MPEYFDLVVAVLGAIMVEVVAGVVALDLVGVLRHLNCTFPWSGEEDFAEPVELPSLSIIVSLIPHLGQSYLRLRASTPGAHVMVTRYRHLTSASHMRWNDSATDAASAYP